MSWEDTLASTSLRGAKSLDVPALGTRDYKLTFYAYKQCKASTVVRFTNESSGEYMLYNVEVNVTAPGKVDVIALEVRCWPTPLPPPPVMLRLVSLHRLCRRFKLHYTLCVLWLAALVCQCLKARVGQKSPQCAALVASSNTPSCLLPASSFPWLPRLYSIHHWLTAFVGFVVYTCRRLCGKWPSAR